jgi:signal transduction histidine kinase
MWEIPYIRFFILVLIPSWHQTILFGLLCAVSVFLVMCVACHLRLRMIRVHFEERFAERTRIARELQDSMLQTVEIGKLVADDALDNSDDPVYMRLALEKLSRWLGQATQEGQVALNSLRTSTTDSHKKAQKSRE